MKTYAIYLDLDGVMADYDAGIRRFGFTPDPALNRSAHLLPGSKSEKKREMYEAIKGKHFYDELPFLPGAIQLYDYVKDADPIILTAAPKFGAGEDDYYLNPYWLGAAFHKRNWVETRLIPAAESFSDGKLYNPDNLSDEVLVQKAIDWIDSEEVSLRSAIDDTRFICTTSARKQEFINRKHSIHQILIDDRGDNIDRWEAAGGIGICYTTFEDAKSQLDDIMFHDPANFNQ
jgi:hypothetical protein